MNCDLDHLVIAAHTLEQGVAWCEATLGVVPGPGGRHALFGTHNRLLRIDRPGFANSYLEVIAVDPEAPSPGRARWFGLDVGDESDEERKWLAAGPNDLVVRCIVMRRKTGQHAAEFDGYGVAR